MNQEIGRAWVEALRSGEYRQASCHLGGESGFCCLGVLSELAHRAGVVGREEYKLGPEFGTELDGATGYRYGDQTQFLPDSVMEWAGLESRDPEVDIEQSDEGLLSFFNDNGWSFADIADLIEKKYLDPVPA